MDSLFRWLGRQDWIRYGIRDRILRRYCNPDTAPSKAFETDFFGLKYRGNLNSFLDWIVYFYGAYEKQNLFLYRDIVNKTTNPVFVDIGANVGHHSLFMSQYCASVHAFEPNSLVRERLEEKIAINAIENIFVHAVGMGDEDAQLPFFASGSCNSGTGSFVLGHSSDNKESGMLRVVQADTYLAKLGLSAIDLIKIDVEGFEKKVLLGLKETIEHYRPVVILEFSDTTRGSFSAEAELSECFPSDYEIHRISSNQPRWKVFNAPYYQLGKFDFDGPECDVLMCPPCLKISTT